MKTIEINLYEFSELSETAKENAINRLSDINIDHDWWTDIYEDAKTIGINITSYDLFPRSINGVYVNDPISVANDIISNHGKKCKTYKIAESFLAANTKEEDREEAEEVFLNDILNEYLNMLERDYNYLLSKEAIIETIESNDYYFTEKGELY